jgi:hypothetical protein
MRVAPFVLAAVVACGESNSPSPTAGSSATAPKTPPPPSADAESRPIAIHGAAFGRIESSGDTGTWVLEHGPCYSGELDGYFGAQAESEGSDGISVRFVKDPSNGWAMKVNIADTCKSGGASCKAIVFTPDRCKTFDVDLAIDTKHSHRVKWFDGTAAVDCKIGKAHVVGKLTLHACRN